MAEPTEQKTTDTVGTAFTAGIVLLAFGLLLAGVDALNADAPAIVGLLAWAGLVLGGIALHAGLAGWVMAGVLRDREARTSSSSRPNPSP